MFCVAFDCTMGECVIFTEEEPKRLSIADLSCSDIISPFMSSEHVEYAISGY